MPITIDLPHVGESVVEGIIGQWLKKPGDKIEKYDPLVEVVTDKVTMEVPSPVKGVLVRILAVEGTTVPMGAPIAEVETGDEPPASQPSRASAAPSEPPSKVGTIGYLVTDVKPVGPTGGGVEESAPLPTRQPAPATPSRPPEPPIAVGGRPRHSPAVRRLAGELKLDLSQVTGTGLGGRVTRDDVLNYSEAHRAAPAALAGPPLKPGADEEHVALTPVRRIIAQNMARSATEIPQAWSTVEVDVSALVKFRESIKEEFLAREGVELTYLPFVIKAVVESLKEHPMLNSSWGGDKIILKKRLHVGIAVAAPDGLVVPVIHNADSLSISGLARASRELTAKARQRKLALADVQGGTFTVNNTGALGSIVSQPIINYPQAAILTSEAIQKRPVVVGDAIAIRSMMNICLTFDHRIVDGAQSGAFLQSVKRRLEAMGPNTPVY